MTDNRDIAEDPAADVPISTPIEVKGTLTKTQFIFIFGQVMAAVGGIIVFMGLGEQTWIVKLYRFFQSAPAVPIISLLAWAAAGLALWFRNKKRAIERAVMAALVSNKVGKVVGPISPQIQAAIDEALKAAIPPRPFYQRSSGGPAKPDKSVV